MYETCSTAAAGLCHWRPGRHQLRPAAVHIPQQTEVTSEFTAKDIRLGLSVEHSDIITGIRLYVHSYTQGMESAQLYKGVLDDTTKIEFQSLTTVCPLLEESLGSMETIMPA